MVDLELLEEELEWQDRPGHGPIFNTHEFLALAKKNGIYRLGIGYWDNQFKESTNTIKYIKIFRDDLQIEEVGNGIIRVPDCCFADKSEKLWKTVREFEQLFGMQEFLYPLKVGAVYCCEHSFIKGIWSCTENTDWRLIYEP